MPRSSWRIDADALRASLELLAEMPEMGTKITARRHHLSGIRRWQVKRPFQKYVIYYRVRGQFLDVLHVVHGAQDIDAIL
jgi:plasmid stabilization system protein ParE